LSSAATERTCDPTSERALVGALLLSSARVPQVRQVVGPEDFASDAFLAKAYSAVLDLHARGESIDPVTVAAALGSVNGTREKLLKLQATCPAGDNILSYARVVHDHSWRWHLGMAARDLDRELHDTAELARHDRDARITAAARKLEERLQERHAAQRDRQRQGYIPGGSFILDAPAAVPAVWGAGEDIAWAAGEPLLIVGPQGVGKTAIAQQLALARIGLLPTVLGWPVPPGDGRMLYIAADRPEQARRSLHRMVSPDDRDLLDELLVVWRGPLPEDLARQPRQLADMAGAHGADTVIVDSLKDVAVKLSDEEVGGLVNRAFQETVTAGVELLTLHHQRKEQRGGGKPKTLADVYGSGFITAGCGSVLLLWGEPGDPVVELSHLKQPAGEIGPVQVLHDQHTGQSSLLDRVDAYAILEAASDGLTVGEAATALYGTSHSTNEREKARRQLDRLVRAGHAHKEAGSRGGGGDRDPARYYLVVDHSEAPE
jgi:replicative DNA helicase